MSSYKPNRHRGINLDKYIPAVVNNQQQRAGASPARINLVARNKVMEGGDRDLQITDNNVLQNMSAPVPEEETLTSQEFIRDFNVTLDEVPKDSNGPEMTPEGLGQNENGRRLQFKDTKIDGRQVLQEQDQGYGHGEHGIKHLETKAATYISDKILSIQKHMSTSRIPRPIRSYSRQSDCSTFEEDGSGDHNLTSSTETIDDNQVYYFDPSIEDVGPGLSGKIRAWHDIMNDNNKNENNNDGHPNINTGAIPSAGRTTGKWYLDLNCFKTLLTGKSTKIEVLGLFLIGILLLALFTGCSYCILNHKIQELNQQQKIIIDNNNFMFELLFGLEKRLNSTIDNVNLSKNRFDTIHPTLLPANNLSFYQYNQQDISENQLNAIRTTVNFWKQFAKIGEFCESIQTHCGFQKEGFNLFRWFGSWFIWN